MSTCNLFIHIYLSQRSSLIYYRNKLYTVLFGKLLRMNCLLNSLQKMSFKRSPSIQCSKYSTRYDGINISLEKNVIHQSVQTHQTRFAKLPVEIIF